MEKTDAGADHAPRDAGSTAASAAWFRAELRALGQTQTGLARWMKEHGDDRLPATILRNVQRMANGEARVSGEMRVILALLRSSTR